MEMNHPVTIGTRTLTTAEVHEELNRMAAGNIAIWIRSKDPRSKDEELKYLRLDRRGATFALDRKERKALIELLRDRHYSIRLSEDRYDGSKRDLPDYENAILARQEKHWEL